MSQQSRLDKGAWDTFWRVWARRLEKAARGEGNGAVRGGKGGLAAA